MSVSVDVSTDGVRIPLARGRVAELALGVLRAERVKHAMLSVAFVSDSRIAALNRRHLRRAGATDVIAFGFERAGAADPVIGDIYIAAGVARRNAAAHGVPVREELARLVVHGVLHALGFDHPAGAERVSSPMWRRQEKLLRKALPGTTRRGGGKARA
jgi:probable rRNA maturation factor